MEHFTGRGEALQELDARESDGIKVALLWNRRTNRLLVAVSDLIACGSFELPVGAGDALEVFRHPFAYAAFRGVDYAMPTVA